MSRLRPALLHLALILMQFLSPWVHAHAAAETSGFLHLPGLESLTTRASDVSSAAPAGSDRVVVMQAGMIKGSNPLLERSPATVTGLPSSPLPVSRQPRRHEPAIGEPPAGKPRRQQPGGPPPRASPDRPAPPETGT